jgi:putative flippase GtrA
MKGFWRFVAFCFVGGTSALVHLIVFNIFFKIFTSFFKIDYLFFGATLNFVFATILGTGISLMYNFTMNRNFTFSARHEKVKKQIPKHIVVYACSIALGFIVNLIVLNILGENTLNANISQVVGIIFSIPISFFGSMLWTFKKKNIN